MSIVEDYQLFREAMNKKLLEGGNTVIKRIYSVDNLAYQPGALDSRTKEMLGLVSSLVLRCDDCVKYHLEKCAQLGVSNDEMHEILGIGMLVGGTIVIPHARRAVEFWQALQK